MISEILNYITHHFTEFLIIVLVSMLFFKEQLTKLIYFRFGLEGRKNGDRRENNGLITAVGEVSRLSNYYNHDLTDKLDAIQVYARQNAETSAKTLTLLEELKEYGIKVRN